MASCVASGWRQGPFNTGLVRPCEGFEIVSLKFDDMPVVVLARWHVLLALKFETNFEELFTVRTIFDSEQVSGVGLSHIGHGRGVLKLLHEVEVSVEFADLKVS